MMVSCCPLSVSIFGSQAYFYSYNLLLAASLLLYSQSLKWRNTIISLYLAFSILQLTTSLLIEHHGIGRRKLSNLHFIQILKRIDHLLVLLLVFHTVICGIRLLSSVKYNCNILGNLCTTTSIIL